MSLDRPTADPNVTAVRLRKLRTGPNYSHTALEAEAAVGRYDDADQVLEKLALWIDQKLGLEEEIDVRRGRAERLDAEVIRKQMDLERLEQELAAYRATIDKFEELVALAVERGLKGALELQNCEQIPF
jgi:hypothetical protein